MRTVVVIEDDQDIRGLIQGVLAAAGLEVQISATGAEGVDAVRRHGPDVIVLDFGLPDFTGVEAAQRIRGFSSAPILMLTGHEDLGDAPFEAGVNDVMAKPFSTLELRKRVENLLESHAEAKVATSVQD